MGQGDARGVMGDGDWFLVTHLVSRIAPVHHPSCLTYHASPITR